MAQLLSEVAVGTTVKINENGSPVDFYVAEHNYESGLNGAGRTLVARKYYYDSRQWYPYTNSYTASTLLRWLNNEYKAMFDSDIQNSMGTTQYYYTPGNGSFDVLTRSDSVFLLSATELGKSGTGVNVEGSPLSIANTLQILSDESGDSKYPQWTRSPYTGNIHSVNVILASGQLSTDSSGSSCGYRPVFTLPENTIIGDDGTIITEISAPSTITVPGLAMQNQTAEISWSAVDGADSYILERNADNGGWTQIYSGANLSYTDTIGAWSTVQYRVKAGISSVYGDYATSDAISVVAASALVISGTNGDLGTLTGPVQYSVSSDTGNAISVTETVNGVALRTYTATSGQQQSIAIPDLPTGSGSIVITASVQTSSGAVNQTRTWSYTKTAPAFPSGPFDIAKLTKGGKLQFPFTLAEAIKFPLGGSPVMMKDGNIIGLDGNAAGVQIATGSYVGTGTSGASNPNTLTFGFEPKFIFIAAVDSSYWGLFNTLILSSEYDSHGYAVLGGNPIVNTSSMAKLDKNTNTLSWYLNGSNVSLQLNSSGITYHYVAIGTGGGGGVTEPPEEAPINFVGGMGVGGVPIVIDKSKILIAPVNDRYTVTIQKSALYMQQATNNASYSLLHTITGGGINTADGSSITTSQRFLNGYSQSSYQMDVYPNAGETPTITISATD